MKPHEPSRQPGSRPGRALARLVGRGPRRASAVAVLVTLPLVLTPGVVDAHPFGPPPRAWLAVDGDTVTLDWQAALDDRLAIGEHLGHLEPGTMEDYLDPDVQAEPDREQLEELAASGRLRGYVREHMAVEQNGRRCEPEVDTADFADHGATTRHRCPGPVDEITVRISMMHDMNTAYRTYGLIEEGPPGPFAMFSAEQPAHHLAVDDLTGESGWRDRVVLALTLAAVAGAATAAVRRLTRTDGSS